jgi:hypothetical protein
MQAFLSYWRPDNADATREHGPSLRHAANGQYRHVRPGDHVWIVTVRQGRLFLIGRIIVGRVVDLDTAREALGNDDLYQADWHILPEPGTEMPLSEIDITDIASKLRFESERDRLSLKEGRVSAQQLQTMRRLDSNSAQRLEHSIAPL